MAPATRISTDLGNGGDRTAWRGGVCGTLPRRSFTDRSVSLARFLACSVADLEDEIVRAEDERREQRRFKRLPANGTVSLDPNALGSLVRVLERQGLRTVGELGAAAAHAWARRVGIQAD